MKKPINKTYLPEKIELRGKTYLPVMGDSALLNLGRIRMLNDDYVIVNVLPRSLKGKTDLHGNLYQPTQWLFKAN